MMRIIPDERSGWYCQHCRHDFNCNDHVFNNTDCSKCEFRHRVFVDLEDLCSIEGLTAKQLKAVEKLQKYYTH